MQLCLNFAKTFTTSNLHVKLAILYVKIPDTEQGYFISKSLIQCNSSQKSLIHNNTLHRTTGFELATSSARFNCHTHLNSVL